MESLPIPKMLTVYQLVKMSTTAGLMFSSTGSAPANAGYIGVGFYFSRTEAEQNRTLETLKNQDGSKYFVFELEVPNPILSE